jgi:DNA replication protein DnaC
MAERSDPRGKTAPKVPNQAIATATRRSTHDDVTAALRTLGITLTADALNAVMKAAERESLSHLEFLQHQLAELAEARRQRALERRIRAAKFRELATLEGFDWEFNTKGLDRRTIEQVVTCDFVRRRENMILVGPTGLGKSRILQSAGHAACLLGYRVRHATSAKLLQEFTAALADGSFAAMLEEYARFDLLLIDEFRFDHLERAAQPQSSCFYYRLLDARMGHRSTALATNMDFGAWADYLGDPLLATSFLDRLVDGAVILKLAGRSYRANRARPIPQASRADRS